MLKTTHTRRRRSIKVNVCRYSQLERERLILHLSFTYTQHIQQDTRTLNVEMANQKTRVEYNPNTKNLPGTNMGVLARALQLIARREARIREKAESQPCVLTFSSSTNLWLQSGATSHASSNTSKENTSSKSPYFSRSTNGCTPVQASDEAQKPEKRKVSPSNYQQEVAREERERQLPNTPQDSVDTTSPSLTAASSKSPSRTDTMTPAEAEELISAAIGTQRRHKVYHGTTLVSNCLLAF